MFTFMLRLALCSAMICPIFEQLLLVLTGAWCSQLVQLDMAVLRCESMQPMTRSALSCDDHVYLSMSNLMEFGLNKPRSVFHFLLSNKSKVFFELHGRLNLALARADIRGIISRSSTLDFLA